MADPISYLYLVRYLEPVGRVDVGKQVFNEKHCSNCRGADGPGEHEGPNLARHQPYYASQLGYTLSVLAPHSPRAAAHPIHPPETFEFGIVLEKVQINDLIAYVEELGKGQGQERKRTETPLSIGPEYEQRAGQENSRLLEK